MEIQSASQRLTGMEQYEMGHRLGTGDSSVVHFRNMDCDLDKTNFTANKGKEQGKNI